MAERAVVTAVILLMVISICLSVTENFIPIGVNLDFRDICRGYLMKMEYRSGLSVSECNALKGELESIGLRDVQVSATESAKAGSIITLDVKAVLTRDSLSSLFLRNEKSYMMEYNRKAVARKVINR